MKPERERISYAIRRINATVDRFLFATTIEEKRQAIKWARAWGRWAGLIALQQCSEHERRRR
ncbi:hypothetical protein QCE47_26960 [Caballeronia sp. LZ025]|uniref:hypothetical protein n=1 Tax=Caballeronia TaxID=1827195 RepID=UPI001FD09381|nr:MULTISPECIES: hypothetical protein [Caballeronia]MDR5735961.1 hypothetical protein [Caballeronia sp. LZ025]